MKVISMTSPASRFQADADRAAEDRLFQLPSGRKLSYGEFGAPRGIPVFGFHGTPGSRFMFRLVHEPAKRLGIRVIAPERPGFGLSTYQHNRTLADGAADIAVLANY